MQPSAFPSIFPSSFPLLLIWVHTSLQVLCRQPVWGCLLTTCQGTYGFGGKILSFSHRLLGPARQQELGDALPWEPGRSFEARGGGQRASGESGATSRTWQRPLRDGRIPGTLLGMWTCTFVQSFPFCRERDAGLLLIQSKFAENNTVLLLLMFSFSLLIFFFFWSIIHVTEMF